MQISSFNYNKHFNKCAINYKYNRNVHHWITKTGIHHLRIFQCDQHSEKISRPCYVVLSKEGSVYSYFHL